MWGGAELTGGASPHFASVNLEGPVSLHVMPRALANITILTYTNSPTWYDPVVACGCPPGYRCVVNAREQALTLTVYAPERPADPQSSTSWSASVSLSPPVLSRPVIGRLYPGRSRGPPSAESRCTLRPPASDCPAVELVGVMHGAEADP